MRSEKSTNFRRVYKRLKRRFPMFVSDHERGLTLSFFIEHQKELELPEHVVHNIYDLLGFNTEF